ncbi:hypothetical protein [Bacillus nitroreducens]
MEIKKKRRLVAVLTFIAIMAVIALISIIRQIMDGFFPRGTSLALFIFATGMFYVYFPNKNNKSP